LTVQLIPITNLRFKRVTYYTVRLGDNPISEFKDFQNRLSKDIKNNNELNEITRFIQQIGDNWGAQEKHFKHERAAERLPPPYYFIETEDSSDYGLRLYCIRLCNEIVILLNGDRKTDRYPDRCPNCAKHFKLANTLAKKITEAITENNLFLNFDKREIDIEDDFEIEI
jgi:hypothetical protein